MGAKKTEISEKLNTELLSELATLIVEAQNRATVQVNSVMTVLFWQVGMKVNEHILQNKRAEYGKEILVTLSRELCRDFGRNFEEKNLRRMLQFANQFRDSEIVVTLSRQLSWSHFLSLFTLKSEDAKSYYAQKIMEEGWGVRQTRKEIRNKSYERAKIADSQIRVQGTEEKNIFKDPYILDFLRLPDGYLENELESAILRDFEKFILELGNGFTFVERQKRMIIDGDDFYLDLLFFNRKLRRLVAIELKIGRFKAAHKGQMELYLKWLNRYDRQQGEEHPIGLILCAENSREQVELLEMGKSGIMVSEYWTELPPKKELEQRLQTSLQEAKARIERKK